MSERKWVHASAAGKVNLYFGVGSLKADGYHDVLSVYQALELREDVSLSQSVAEPHVAVAGNIRREQLDVVPRGESNLVFKAVRLVENMAGLEPADVDFEIFKRVPVAGGMAGGSADAAAGNSPLDERHDASSPFLQLARTKHWNRKLLNVLFVDVLLRGSRCVGKKFINPSLDGEMNPSV